MKIDKYFRNKQSGTYLLVLVVLLCAACGTQLVRGEPPLVRMTELSHGGGKINLQLNIRNINGVDLNIQGIDLKLTVTNDENEDGHQLMAYEGGVGINIVANGVETWSVDVMESDKSRELLDSLENGDVMSLPFTLKGSIDTRDEGTMRFEFEGHIYPLPGKPGHFR